MKHLSVALSDYHRGQICYPTVEAYRQGTRIHVKLTWVDTSLPRNRQHYQRSEFTAVSVRAAEDWLTSQGVRLDAQGIF